MARACFDLHLLSRSASLTAYASGRFLVLAGIAGGALAMGETSAHAFNSLRAGALSNKGSSSSSQAATAATVATTQAAQTNVLAQHAQASYAHSVQALQAVEAAQAAARSSALNGANNLGLNPMSPGTTLPNVTEGLGGTGLVPTNPLAVSSTTTTGTSTTTAYQVPISWSLGTGGALTQTTASNSATVTDTVTQAQPQALLYWNSFNVGKNTTLTFNQSAGGANVDKWVAINMVSNSVAPSQILGSIQAPGQVYVIDQNGIIFGGSSQVNVGALTASSLALNPAYIANGLLNNAGNNFQFQFSSLFTTSSQLVSVNGHNVMTTVVSPLWTAPAPDATGTVPSVSSVPTGDVTVQAGAQLSSPVDGENQGGRIALIAPNVINNGTISTPNGQTILAAGLQVGLAAHNSDDASLRGLDVFIGQVNSVASTLPTGTFLFNGLPNNGELTFSGADQAQVGTYTPPNSTTPIALTANMPVTIPVGSTVTLTSGSPSYSAAQGGTVTNGANTLDGQGNIVSPGGDIESPLAAVTLAGQTVNQMGIINGSTSVTLNGRIDLLADYDATAGLVNNVTTLFPFASGTVNLGSQSVTQILPDLASTDTTIGTELPFSSLVNIQGLNVEMFPGSLLLAPGARAPSTTSSPALDLVGTELTSGVTLDAGSWFIVGSQAGAQHSVFSNSDGGISLDSGSMIDVSGSENVSASVAEDVIPVELRGPQLANSPLQRNGALRGVTVYIDIRNAGVYDGTAWIGTPIGDVSGYADDIQRTVGELTTDGGTVSLNAGASVSTAAGASINVSGGWVNYSGANVQSTKVVSNGQLLDISQATPDLVYQGLFATYAATSSKWGVSETFSNSLNSDIQFDPGYVQGGNGGSISITAPDMTLGGNFYGNTVAGAYQRTPQASLDSTYAGASFLPTTLKISGLPQPSLLDISFLQSTVDNNPKIYSTSSPDIEFQSDSFISQNVAAPNQILLSQDIVNNDGFGDLTIDTSANGTIWVPQGVALIAPTGGLLDFTAANITIDGSLSAPGGGTNGGLSFTVLDISPTAATNQLSTPAPDPTRGHFTLGPGASLSSSGDIVDDRPTASAPDTLPLATVGGTISIAALDVDLEPGSSIDVSGGGAISSAGKVTYGNAGKISILGGQDPSIASLVTSGQLELGATLTGYSGNIGGGGTLTIQAPLVQIGGTSLLNGDSSASAFEQGEASVTSNGNTLWLGSGFFSQGGFGSFDIEGLGQIETDGAGTYLFNSAGDPIVSPAVLIASGTALYPIVESSTAIFDGSTLAMAPLSQAQEATLLPSQRTPVNLILNAEGVTSGFSNDGPPQADGSTYANSGGGGGVLVRGDLELQAGASIQTDPQTNSANGVSLLAGHGMAAILGTIYVPGGTITITGGNTTSVNNNQLLFYQSLADQPFPTVDLGPGSFLSTAGVAEQTQSSNGYYTGSVLPGGHINISGNIVGEAGATLDVSGASAIFQETPAALGNNSGRIQALVPVSTLLSSNGGSITLKGNQLLYSDATLLGAAGGSASQGGSLSISTGYAVTANPGITAPSTLDVNLIVSQQGLNGGFSLPVNAPTGLALLDGQALPSSPADVGVSVNSAISGEPVYSYFAANTNLFLGATGDHASSNNGGRAGGFASLSLAGTLDFVGAVDISTSSSLTLAMSSGNANSGETGGVIYANAPVVLTSPYVALNSYQASLLPDQITDYSSASAGAGSLTVNAGTLADVGNLSLQNISTLTFNSNPAVGGDIRGAGTLQVAGQINLNARQIYPPTEETFTIEANDVSITAPTTEGLPSLPLSGGGILDIFANTIEQSGVLRAPFGIINLGNSATQSVTLSAGSITSVSGVDPETGIGITVPYGIVNQNGTWYDPQGNDISLTGPPAKQVNVNGQNISLQSGSTIDLTGGGSLYAYAFTSGTGGTQDILASTGAAFSSTSFAIVPGYSLNYAPDGTYNTLGTTLQTNGVSDAGYYNANLAVGEEIYLKASNGLPAGMYTLLPARYALLPGAFLITSSSGGAPGTALAEPDGSTLVAGYVTNSLSPTSSPLYSAYQIYNQASVFNQAPYTVNLANSYFPATASNNNLSVPRLPMDSGQLVLDATQTMIIQGMLLSNAAAGGLGGLVDIASPEEIDIVGPDASANIPSGVLVLDSAQLTSFGASSLLIGGYRTTTDAGTSVTVTTNSLVVDNSGATTTVDGISVAGLAAPDIILVSNGTMDIAAGSAIEQFGNLSGSAQALTLQGDGTLLRVSSDPSAQINRQNVIAGDTTSLLSIGQGVQILNENGGAAGALTFDSTALVQISTSMTAAPVLSGKSLTIDSSLINLELGTPATAPTTGLVITGTQLDSLLSSAQSLSLLSYSSIALYGSGQIGAVSVDASGQKIYQETSLALHADDIYYADTVNSSGIILNAQTVSFDNLSQGTALPSLTGLGTSDLTVNAQTISLGSGAMRVDQFGTVALNADSAILLKGLGTQASGSDSTPIAASFNTSGNLVMTTPLLTGASTADQAISTTTTVAIDETISAAGSVVLQAPADDAVSLPTPSTLATNLSMIGSSITQDSGSIVLHSGSLSLLANGMASGSDVVVNGTLDVSGVSPTFYSLAKFTNGGQVTLTSLEGNVSVGSTGLVNVSAASGAGSVDSGAGSGGSLTVSAAGIFSPGQIEGQAGVVTQAGVAIAQGAGGTFSLDVGSLDSSGAGNGFLSTIESGLMGFESQTIRDRNDSTVTVDGTVVAPNFNLSADTGSIVVTGKIDASNVLTSDPNGNPILVGGTIDLAAGGSVTLASTAILNASGQNFSNADEGGTVTIDAGSYEGISPSTSSAAIDLAAGSQIDLSVAGGSGGTLHLRAPQVSGGAYVAGATYTPVAVNAANGGTPTDVAIAPIADGVVKNAGSITVEGFYVQDAQQASATIDSFESTSESNAASFMSNAATIQSRLFGSNSGPMEIQPGEEIDNSAGSLELQSTWDLSSLRYGAPLLNAQGNQLVDGNGNPILSVPGILTIRAAGDLNIDFGASLNDGFSGSAGVALDRYTLQPVGSQSWSYQLTAGGDFAAADPGDVQSTGALQNSGLGGSVQIGYQNTTNPILLSDFSTDNLNRFYQTIRTGSGSITINSGGDVLLLNNLATIYTAGSQVDGTLGGTFAPPSGSIGGTSLPATYSSGGGNVTISARGEIAHETYDPQGDALVADSSAELPTSWLDREGSASLPTTWWVDFTNFFEGIGALGGGNVTLAAGGSIVNVDAVVPTNARLVNGQLTELGGGDLTVQAGTNIDGGVYYVESGQGTLAAANNIQTNATRAAVILGAPSTPLDWLPTTIFLGKGDFDVAAGGNLLLGPIANPFLLPQSYNNIASTRDLTSEISYFSTYAATDAIDASSLGGTVTIQDFADGGGQGSLYDWYTNIMDAPVRRATLGSEVSAAQPWLLLAEAGTSPTNVIADFGPAGVFPEGAPSNDFGGATALLPPTLRVTAFGGDINLLGSLTLSPSSDGTVDLVAEGAINAFETNLVSLVTSTVASGSGLVNLSDANPALLPSVTAPFSSGSDLSVDLDPLFTPTGATEGLTLQAKQEFHADIDGETLHANAPNADPAYIYANTGDISGLTLFSAIQTQVIAGQDLTDVGLYLQNNSATDISLVEAGRDIIAYDATSPLRENAGIDLLNYEPTTQPLGAAAGAPNSGDIQISGPGALEVLAGRNLTLGNDAGQNPNNTVSGIGLYTGLTSVGSQVNPALPFGGADLIAAAGVGSGFGLDNGNLNFAGFTDMFLDPSVPSNLQPNRYLPDLGALMGIPGAGDQQIWAAFNKLDSKAQDALALKVFYLVLRDTARDHNDPTSPNFGLYTEGYAAVSALFPNSYGYSGNLNVTSREIKTTSGGDINLLIPGGGLTVGINQAGGQAVDQGILTVDGGNISIFANGDVSLGTSRIFTLHGGNEVIWSTTGNIDAGAASVTVVSAPPTRVLVDPTSGAVETDLAGLATGGGIGVLQSVAGAPPGDIDLIAPVGTVDAGDAGIRASGKIFLAAAHVANAGHIVSAGGTSGAPAGAASVNLGALTAASSAAGSSQAAVQNGTPNHQNLTQNNQDLPSIITVEVLGYGGGDQD